MMLASRRADQRRPGEKVKKLAENNAAFGTDEGAKLKQKVENLTIYQ